MQSSIPTSRRDKIKNYLLPVLIILVTGFTAANLIVRQKATLQSESQYQESSQGLQLLTLKAPGMFCIGCSASVEGYLGAIEGVKQVNASLASKKVNVIYDPQVVSKDTILNNEILDAYGKEFISNEPFTSSTQMLSPSTTSIPQDLAFKLQEAAAKVSQLENSQEYQLLFDQIDQAIVQEDYQQAEQLVDDLLNRLK